jgi:maltose/moltooligosaccharide transporter
MSLKKPQLSNAQIWYLSFGFLGIQGGFALQNGNASRILQIFGADIHQLSWFWLVAPFTGLIVQPIIGHFSDKTWNALGRRKPFFLLGAILAFIGLILLPNANSVLSNSSSTFLGMSLVLWFGGLFLAFMDASFNIAMEPFRALVGDMLPKNQSTAGFGVQTGLIGIGAVIGSWLPWFLHNKMGIPNTAAEGIIPPNVVYSFYVGAVILLGTVLITIFKTKEYPPEQFIKYQNEDSTIASDSKTSKSSIIKDFMSMPERMKGLGFVQFFSWFGLFTMWVYTTSAIATHHYHLSPDDHSSASFGRAGDWVGILFGIYNAVSAVYAFLIHKFAARTSRKFVHIFSLTAGGIGLLSMYFISNPDLLWIPMIGVGLAWGSILSIPYTLLVDKIPTQKMGVYMGIFNFFIVIPQIINGLIGGIIVRDYCNNYPIKYVMIGGIFFLLAAAFTFRIKEPLFNEKKKLESQ